MNPIHQWLEGKKKDIEEIWQKSELNDKRKLDLISIGDLQADLPSLLSTMEAEIRKHILEELLAEIPEDTKQPSTTLGMNPIDEFIWHENNGRNAERRRQREIYTKKLQDITKSE